MSFLSDWFWATVGGGLMLTWVLLILGGLERLSSRGRPPSLRTILLSARYAVVYAPIAALAVTGTSWLLALSGVRPFVDLPLHDWFRGAGAVVGSALVPLVGIILWDFFYYWCHRAQHAVPFLWRLHTLHHSVRELGAATAVQHWSEGFIRAALVTVPLYLFAHIDDGPRATVAVVFIAMQGYYAHSTLRVSFGPWARFVLADNRSHRIHHSLEPRHWNKNFGAPTMLWDCLFGTAYLPAKDEWPDVGLDTVPPPRSVTDFLRWKGPGRTLNADQGNHSNQA